MNDEERKTRRREYCAANRDRINQRRRESRERMKREHPEKWAAYREQQREYSRERYWTLKDQGLTSSPTYSREQRAKYLAEHAEKIRQWRRDYYARKKSTDPDWWASEQAQKRERERLRGPRKRNPERHKLYQQRHIARKNGLPLPPLPEL